MFIVIGIMFVGIVVGFLLRDKIQIKTNRIVTVLIWLLLFVLGIEVGSNKDLVNNLNNIGLDAFIIGIAGVLGSIFGAKLFWNWIKYK